MTENISNRSDTYKKDAQNNGIKSLVLGYLP